jgi:small subunit ribosomal protein S6
MLSFRSEGYAFMQLRRYEALMLTVPEITQDEVKLIETSLDAAAKTAGGSVMSFERWGKFKLAYPVNKNDYGVYFLSRFEVPNGITLAKDLESLFTIKLHEIVSRSKVARLADMGSLEYNRPKSLEEMPSSRDVERFLKDNKMTGLLRDKGDLKSSEQTQGDYFDEEMEESSDHLETERE